ncbi:hypothetical protein AB9K41_25725, partial [Cribrihabitans sp. XS_ASV171]
MSDARPRGIAAALVALCLAAPVMAEEVTLSVTRQIDRPEGTIPYRLDLALRDVAPARIGLDARLDLRELQAHIADHLSKRILVDTCNSHITLEAVRLTAEDTRLAAGGKLLAQFFACERDRLRPQDRGETLFSQSLAMAAAVSATVSGNCVRFRLDDLRFEQEGPVTLTDEQRAFLDKTR